MTGDKWAQWLRHNRFGGDASLRERTLHLVAQYRDKVLEGAAIKADDVVLDVGCGDGLLGFGAVERTHNHVIFSDVSKDLLRLCEEAAGELGVRDRCEFVNTGLPGLEGIADQSVDVAMTRSVLIYVKDKAASTAALHRVLRNGGRLSIFEPINSFSHPSPANELFGFDITGLEDLAAKVRRACEAYQPADDAMIDFDERDLLDAVQRAGFTEIQLDYRAEIKPQEGDGDGWAAVLKVAPNPLVPPLGEILTEALTPAERERLTARTKRAPGRSAHVYLTAAK